MFGQWWQQPPADITGHRGHPPHSWRGLEPGPLQNTSGKCASHQLGKMPLQDHPDPERSYKIPRVSCFSPQFPSVEGEEKRFVVKEKVIAGVCRAARLCWLEWNCTGENRSVPRGGELPTPGAHLEQPCEMKSTADSSLWQPSLWKAASEGGGVCCVTRYTCRNDIFSEAAKTLLFSLAWCPAPPTTQCV